MYKEPWRGLIGDKGIVGNAKESELWYMVDCTWAVSLSGPIFAFATCGY